MLTDEPRVVPGFVPVFGGQPHVGWKAVGVETGRTFAVVQVEDDRVLMDGGISGRCWYRRSDVQASVDSGRFRWHRPRRRGEVPEGNREVEMAKGKGVNEVTGDILADEAVDTKELDILPSLIDFPVVSEAVFTKATPMELAEAHDEVLKLMDQYDETKAEIEKAQKRHKSEKAAIELAMVVKRKFLKDGGERRTRPVVLRYAPDSRNSMVEVVDPKTGEVLNTRRAEDKDRKAMQMQFGGLGSR